MEKKKNIKLPPRSFRQAMKRNASILRVVEKTIRNFAKKYEATKRGGRKKKKAPTVPKDNL